jgi:hypothetical protein
VDLVSQMLADLRDLDLSSGDTDEKILEISERLEKAQLTHVQVEVVLKAVRTLQYAKLKSLG